MTYMGRADKVGMLERLHSSLPVVPVHRLELLHSKLFNSAFNCVNNLLVRYKVRSMRFQANHFQRRRRF